MTLGNSLFFQVITPVFPCPWEAGVPVLGISISLHTSMRV